MRELSWRRWKSDGSQYLRAASGKGGEESRFSPTIQYNLLSMGVEGFIMAILDYHNSLPDNHTLTDLINALQDVYPVAEDLKNKILEYDGVQNLCPLDPREDRILNRDELADFRDAVREIEKIADAICAGDKPEGVPAGRT